MKEITTDERITKIEKGIHEMKAMLKDILDIVSGAQQDRDKEIFSVQQLADFMKVDINLIYAKCANDQIPYFKVGKRYRFEKRRIVEWMSNQKIESGFSVNDYVERYMQKNILKS